MDDVKTATYIKAIYHICTTANSESASTGVIAKRLNVSSGTATPMLQRLAQARLVDYKAYHGARLTDAGRRMALQIIRRHRLLELFLVKALNVGWDEVHAEAERLEHAVSDQLVDRIDAFLGSPDFDPHGDPVPHADGELVQVSSQPLPTCQTGQRFVLERVLNQSPEFLRYLSNAELRIGAIGTLIDNQPSAGIVSIRTTNRDIPLSHESASQVLVRPL